MDSRFSFKNLFIITMMFLLTKFNVGLSAQQSRVFNVKRFGAIADGKTDNSQVIHNKPPYLRVFNVKRFGAIADGKTDNSQAFLKAWNRICGLEGYNTLLVPYENRAFMLRQVTFKGPCKGRIQFFIKGTIEAFTDKSAIFGERWITFQYLNNFQMRGGGIFNGQGQAAWPYNSCSKGPCPKFPSTLSFYFLKDSVIDNINSKDSKGVHIHLFGCSHVTLQHIHIKAPKDSPNTDGIRMGLSDNIKILDSTIGTGDDCVAILPGMQDTYIGGVQCGPGHGISVGSLGRYPHEKEINGLIVKNCTLTGTQNGVRIKSWGSPYKSWVYNFTFQDIKMENAQNPILIDQHYCPHGDCAQGSESHVSIKKVTYDNIWGTSATEVAVNLQCSSVALCKDIILKGINIRKRGNRQSVKSSCSFVQGASYGVQSPKACI